VIFSLEILEKK